MKACQLFRGIVYQINKENALRRVDVWDINVNGKTYRKKSVVNDHLSVPHFRIEQVRPKRI